MATDEFDADALRMEQTGVPPEGKLCPICGSDLHGAEAHHADAGAGVGAVAPRGAALCEICGSDLHSTAQHPGR